LHHNSTPFQTSFFTRELLTKNNLTVVTHPPYSSLFPRLKIKLKGHHFDTTEVIEVESQAVLNTLTIHDFQDAFKNDKSAGNGAYARKRTTWRVMVANRPKVNFDQMAAPDLKIIDSSLYASSSFRVKEQVKPASWWFLIA
jgi:hypothetical protein